MDRRSFLKRSAAGVAVAACQWSGASRLLANDDTASKGDKNDKSNSVIDDKNYRHLMRLGVSPIGLGCLPMVGYYGGKYDKNEMIALIRRAYDKGVTFFDTAEVYGPYTSEEWVGEALQHNMPLVHLVKKHAERKGITMAQFALVWMLSRKSWIVPIPGTTNAAHLDDFLGAANVRLTPEELSAFDNDYSQIHLMGHRADAFTESQIDK